MVINHILKDKHINMMKYIRKREGCNLRQIALASGFTGITIRKILIEFEDSGLINEVFKHPDSHNRNFKIIFTDKGLKILELVEELEKTIKEGNYGRNENRF